MYQIITLYIKLFYNCLINNAIINKCKVLLYVTIELNVINGLIIYFLNFLNECE